MVPTYSTARRGETFLACPRVRKVLVSPPGSKVIHSVTALGHVFFCLQLFKSSPPRLQFACPRRSTNSNHLPECLPRLCESLPCPLCRRRRRGTPCPNLVLPRGVARSLPCTARGEASRASQIRLPDPTTRSHASRAQHRTAAATDRKRGAAIPPPAHRSRENDLANSTRCSSRANERYSHTKYALKHSH